MKRILLSLSFLVVASACGPAIDGKWRTLEFPFGDNWSGRDELEFNGKSLTISSECYLDRGYESLTYTSDGYGDFKLTQGAIVVPEKIRVRGGYFDECDWDFPAGEYPYVLSSDGSTLTVFTGSGKMMNYYRE